MRVILICFLLSASNVFCQNINIKIISLGKPVPFVTITDSLNGIIGASDESGIFKLKQGNYNLRLTHVSFIPQQVYILKVIQDTLINIFLLPKPSLLSEIQVVSNKINKNKYFQVGSYYQKTSSSFVIREKLLLGVKLTNIYNSGDVTKYLRSIKFKLDRFQIGKKDFILEFKIYKFNGNGELEIEPLNKIPIYLKASELKHNNEIKILEKLKLPENNLLISVELPEVFDMHYDWTIPFLGDFNGDIPSTFVMRNKDGNWDSERLIGPKNSLKLDNGRYFVLNFSLTYWNVHKNKH
jgi:hypothetical protein